MTKKHMFVRMICHASKNAHLVKRKDVLDRVAESAGAGNLSVTHAAGKRDAAYMMSAVKKMVTSP